MRATVDPRFLHDWVAHSLRFTCEDCLYFLAESQVCAHEWPTDEHRLPLRDVVVFCKEFELT
jgi:hypothetical protein